MAGVEKGSGLQSSHGQRKVDSTLMTFKLLPKFFYCCLFCHPLYATQSILALASP